MNVKYLKYILAILGFLLVIVFGSLAIFLNPITYFLVILSGKFIPQSFEQLYFPIVNAFVYLLIGFILEKSGIKKIGSYIGCFIAIQLLLICAALVLIFIFHPAF